MKDFYTSCEASRVLSYYLFMQHGVAKTSQPNKTITWNASSASFFGPRISIKLQILHLLEVGNASWLKYHSFCLLFDRIKQHRWEVTLSKARENNLLKVQNEEIIIKSEKKYNHFVAIKRIDMNCATRNFSAQHLFVMHCYDSVNRCKLLYLCLNNIKLTTMSFPAFSGLSAILIAAAAAAPDDIPTCNPFFTITTKVCDHEKHPAKDF